MGLLVQVKHFLLRVRPPRNTTRILQQVAPAATILYTGRAYRVSSTFAQPRARASVQQTLINIILT